MKTLVIGGTGTVGSQVTAELLKRGAAVRVMSRRSGAAVPEGAEAVTGDLQRPETLPAALAGVDALFLATAVAPDETVQGLAAMEAARAAALKYLVYMSVHGLEAGSHIPHFASKLPIEYAVKTSGIPYTILRPNNFFQNDFWYAEAMTQWGVYPQPMSGKGLNRVDVRDIAEAAAIAMTTPGHAGRTYPAVGPDALTGEQTAEIYSRYLGRPLRYTGADLGAWEAEARKSMPEWLVIDLRIMYAHFVEHGLVARPGEVEEFTRVLGRSPRRFEAFAAEVAPGWRASGAGASSSN